MVIRKLQWLEENKAFAVTVDGTQQRSCCLCLGSGEAFPEPEYVAAPLWPLPDAGGPGDCAGSCEHSLGGKDTNLLASLSWGR